MKKALSFFTALTLLSLTSQAQVQSVSPESSAQNGALTATAYDWEAIGINPANLGWNCNHIFSCTILNVGAEVQSRSMNLPTLLTAITSPNPVVSIDNWQSLLGTPGGANINSDVNWASLSFRLPKFPGTIALDLRDRVMANGYLGPQAAQALNNTNNREYSDSAILSLLQGTKLHLVHYREINIAYGSPILNLKGASTDDDPELAKCFSFHKGGNLDDPNQLALYGGVGFKYLIGMANIDANVNKGINATYSMMNNYPNVSSIIPANAPGHGVAFDLGLGAAYKRWKFGWSVTDLGSIDWKHTSITTGDTNVAAITHGSDLVNQFRNGTLAGSQPYFDGTTNLPAKMRMGASYRLTKKIILSSDVIIPLIKTVDNISAPYFALGGQFTIYKRITILTGVNTVSGSNVNVPFGLSIGAGKHISFYAGTTDVSAYLGAKSNADIAAAIGMFRIDF